MSPQRQQFTGGDETSMRERITTLETLVGDAQNGLLGEVNKLRDAMRGVELRLASLVAVTQIAQYFLLHR